MSVDEHTIDLAGSPVFFRTAELGPDPVLYLHSAPTSSDDWLSFLAVTGGIAPDLIGYGRSGKGGHLDFSLDGQVAFVEALLETLEIDRARLVGHGWGAAAALALAQRAPGRFGAIVIIDAVPLFEAGPWPRALRVLRKPVLGELAMGAITRTVLNRLLRRASTTEHAWSAERLAAVWDQFDQGTQRAILRLHRWASAERLAAAGERLESVENPVLILWGECDPWLPPALAEDYARRLPSATAEMRPNAGHWPWLDDPAVIERVAGFLAQS